MFPQQRPKQQFEQKEYNEGKQFLDSIKNANKMFEPHYKSDMGIEKKYIYIIS